MAFLLSTLVAGAVAALAAWCSAALKFEVWLMFVGFIAWFTSPTSWRAGLSAITCLWLGLALGAIAYVATAYLRPFLGALAMPFVVFIVGVLIVGLRTVPVVNNMLAWFLGLVAFFAAKTDISLGAYAHLAAATALGGFAAWACQSINEHLIEE